MKGIKGECNISRGSKVKNWIYKNVLSYKFLVVISLGIIGEKILVNYLLNIGTNALKTMLDILLVEAIVIPTLYLMIKSRNNYISEEQAIKKLAFYDSLTGLPNRCLLSSYFKEIFVENSNEPEFVAVMFLDLDGFKVINDTLGHSIGDKVLVALSKRLKNSVREYDMVCRLGGDEFIILFPKLNKEESIVTVAEKVLKVFTNPFSIDGNELSITSSIGISLSPHHGKSLEELIKNADVAMYKCKRNGKNCYSFFSNVSKEKEVDILNKYVCS